MFGGHPQTLGRGDDRIDGGHGCPPKAHDQQRLGDADCRHCQLTLACIVTGLTKPADRLSIRTDFGLMGISETLQ